MKKFIYRLLIYLAIIFTIGLIKLALYPNNNYAYSLINLKLKFLEKHPEYNTYFIGSSKIDYQIDCKIIDQINPKLKSYNLGGSGSFNLENFQTIDYIFENKDFKPKYIILELQDRINISMVNYKSDRSFGLYNFTNTQFALEIHSQERSIKQLLLTVNSFILNIFHFSKTIPNLDLENINDSSSKNRNGFMPPNSNGLKSKSDTIKLKKIIADRLQTFNKDNNHYIVREKFAEKLNRLSDECRKRGIQLILLLPGPAEPNAKQLLVYKKVIFAPVITLIDPKENPEFYQIENRLDYGHLNEKGSEILSKKVAISLKEILK